MTEVSFFDTAFDPGCVLTYAVIVARSEGRWILVRHHLRTTTEIPGGHIEAGETADEAACRELMEETGAVLFTIECVATYSVTIDGEIGWGRLYFAEITGFGPIPDTSEIAEVIPSDHLPEQNTYPGIQPKLFQRVLEYLEEIG